MEHSSFFYSTSIERTLVSLEMPQSLVYNPECSYWNNMEYNDGGELLCFCFFIHTSKWFLDLLHYSRVRSGFSTTAYLLGWILHRLHELQRVCGCWPDGVRPAVLEHPQRCALIGGAAGVVHPAVQRRADGQRVTLCGFCRMWHHFLWVLTCSRRAAGPSGRRRPGWACAASARFSRNERRAEPSRPSRAPF